MRGWNANLPYVVEAAMYTDMSNKTQVREARTMHHAFLKRYNLSVNDVPLLRLRIGDLRKRHPTPFDLIPSAVGPVTPPRPRPKT